MKQLLFILLFGLSIFSFGQNNLVINSSFENIAQCPSAFSQIDSAYNWFQPIRQFSTSDLFNICSTSSNVDIPNNFFGNQMASSGNGYAGIALYVSSSESSREYIECKLNEPLKKDFTYCVEFYVSLAEVSSFAISSIGALFSMDSVLCNNACFINAVPQIQNDTLDIVSDKTSWTRISGNFIANGGEEFMTLGNFKDNSITERHLIDFSLPSKYSYYYIDSITVIACDSPLVEEPQDTTFVFIPNVFSPNKDGENDLWEVTASKVNSLNIQVFNRWGEQVYIFNSQNLQQDTSTTLSVTYNPAWDGYTPTGKPVPEGTYFYIVQYTLPNGETKVEKGYVTLVR